MLSIIDYFVAYLLYTKRTARKVIAISSLLSAVYPSTISGSNYMITSYHEIVYTILNCVLVHTFVLPRKCFKKSDACYGQEHQNQYRNGKGNRQDNRS